jgi:hypothetical protein
MSTERTPLTSEHSEDVSVTSFSGGRERGRCLQLTQANVRGGRYVGTGHVQLDEDQAALLALDILDWLDGSRSEQAVALAHRASLVVTPA